VVAAPARRLRRTLGQRPPDAHGGPVLPAVRAFAKAHNIPVIDCGRGERKHRIAEDYLATHTVSRGVFLILVARAAATVWEVKRSASGVIATLRRRPPTSTTTRFSAPRGALSYPRFSWEELGGAFLGLMAYLDLKGEGDNSMPGNQRSCPGVGARR
jgi:hypothetical protein